MIASAGPQLLVVAGAVIASSSPSAVSWLYFANRLIELPLGIVGVAMGTVLVPELTRGVRGDDRGAIAHAESRGLELAVGLALPATLGLIVLSEPIVRMLFEHGAFTAADTAATAQALMWLALGLPAHVLVKALSPAFFAREDTLHAAVGDAEGICGRDRAGRGARPCVRRQRHRRRASRSAPGAARFSLIRRGAATFGFSIDAAARRRLPRIVAAALAMGGLLWLTAALCCRWRRPHTASRRRRCCWLLICRRNRDLRPASGPVRRHRLGRSGGRDPAKPGLRLARLRPAWQTTAPQHAMALAGS